MSCFPMPLATCPMTRDFLTAFVSIRYREPSVLAERARGDLDPWRRLASLVLAHAHEMNDPFHGLPVEAHPEHFLKLFIVLDICLEDGIKNGIEGQGIAVPLVRPQFRGGRIGP